MKGLMGQCPLPRIFGLEPPLALTAFPGFLAGIRRVDKGGVE